MMTVAPLKVLYYTFLSSKNSLIKDSRMTFYAIVAVSTLPAFITINSDSITYKVAPSFANPSTYQTVVTV